MFVLSPTLAREPAAADDRHLLAVVADADAAAEEDLDLPRPPHRKQPGVFQEEGTFLREEQVEAIQVDLLLVDLHLREVGVVGRVERHARGDAVLQVDADFTGADGPPVRRGTHRLAQHVRGQLQILLTRHLESLQLARERQPVQIELARQRRPERPFVALPNVALEVDAPRLYPRRSGSAGSGTECANSAVQPISVIARRHLPGAVPVQVEAAARSPLLLAAARAPAPAAASSSHAAAALAFVGDLAVILHAGRVGAEDEPVLLVQVRVEDDLEAVGFRSGTSRGGCPRR